MLNNMISTAPGFQASVNISYDLNDTEKVKRLIPTTAAVELFRDLLLSTDESATDRARILIGAYGKGKSHIILAALAFLYRKDTEESGAMLAKIKELDPDLYGYAMTYVKSQKRLLPVIINGSNTSLIQSFMGALYHTLQQNELAGLMPETHFEAACKMICKWREEYPETLVLFEKAVNMPAEEFLNRLAGFDVEAYSLFEQIYPTLTAGSEFNPFAGFDVVELYEKVCAKLPEAGYSGIFVVYDEFSKYLESSITKASISDIKMLQDFAEKCGRSGARQLHLLLISHKEIENYIDVLPKQKVDGWKGVSERFKHVHMHNNFSQLYEIIAHAILKEPEEWTEFYKKNRARFRDLQLKYEQGLLFSDCKEQRLESIFKGCYPLHPVTIFMLPRISEKVAQNERTLFTFISGREQFTLQETLKEASGIFPLVTPDVLYDYFAPQMRKEVYTSEIYKLYRLTTSILTKTEPKSLKSKIIKTISLIYCLGQFERLAPTVETLVGIYSSGEVSAEEVRNAIVELVEEQCVVYLKRSNAFLKLKESSGVNIYAEIEKVTRKRDSAVTVTELLNQANLEPYIYPLKYNDEYEMTRYFEMVFITEKDIKTTMSLQRVIDEKTADGVVFGVLPDSHETEQDEPLADYIRQRSEKIERALFVMPNNSEDIVESLRKLDAVQILRENAEGDDILFDEYDVIYQDLTEIVHRFISQYTHPEIHASKYFYAGREMMLYRKAHLTQLLSDICEDAYADTPVINNEILNKNRLTTVAKKSRERLVAGLLAVPLQPNLGLNGSGQDVSFMRSSLLNTKVLQTQGENLVVDLNPPDEKLRTVLQIIETFLKSATHKTSFEGLYQTLTGKANGIGMRKGLVPIYLAAVLRKYQKNVVIQDQYGEVAISAGMLDKINDNPEDYQIQLEIWTDNKQTYIDCLDHMFADYIYDADRDANSYAYLAVAMGRWYLSLPKFAKDLRRAYQGRNSESQFVPVDREKQKFLALLKQPSIGAFDLLFTRIPKCFGCEELTDDLLVKIADTKTFYDMVKADLLSTLKVDLSTIFDIDKKEAASLTSLMRDWMESLTITTRNKLYANNAERVFGVIEDATNDEYSLVERMARAISGLRIDDWHETNIDAFLDRVEEYKKTIDDENADEQKTPEVVNQESEQGMVYAVTFVDAEGNAVHREFERVERSSKTNSMYNRIKAAVDQAGQAVSPQEKRQVIMEILEKLC